MEEGKTERLGASFARLEAHHAPTPLAAGRRPFRQICSVSASDFSCRDSHSYLSKGRRAVVQEKCGHDTRTYPEAHNSSIMRSALAAFPRLACACHPSRAPTAVARTRRRGITKRPYPRSRKRCLAPALVSKLSPLRRASLPRPSPLALLATVLRAFLAMQHGELLQLTLHVRLSVHLPSWR